MKKQFIRFLLGIFYIALIVVLLFTHLQQIAGEAVRIFAMIETLLLVIPAIILLYLYTHIKDTSDAKPAGSSSPVISAIDHEQLAGILTSYNLSNREIEVAWLLYKGYTNRQIGEELFIAESTVKKHVSHVYEKIQVSGRKEFKEKVRTSL